MVVQQVRAPARLDDRRADVLERFQQQRKSRAIALIHREETVGLLGVPDLYPQANARRPSVLYVPLARFSNQATVLRAAHRGHALGGGRGPLRGRVSSALRGTTRRLTRPAALAVSSALLILAAIRDYASADDVAFHPDLPGAESALTDVLTGLKNRRGFQEAAMAEIERGGTGVPRGTVCHIFSVERSGPQSSRKTAGEHSEREKKRHADRGKQSGEEEPRGTFTDPAL